jgi:transcriptional regulator with XRE-family HTH domain
MARTAKTKASPSLGSRLRAARERAGLTQAELAEKVDCVQGSVSAWELGTVTPRPEQLKKLRGVLPPFRVPSAQAPKKSLAQSRPPTAQPSGAPSAYGNWLNETRVKKGLTITSLADKSGVGYWTIANVESGRTQNPREEARDKLAGALGVTEPPAVTKETEEAAEVEGVGQFIDFDPHEVASRPRDPGIYVFYDVSDRPIYVGESDSISRRIRSHEEKFWFKRPIVDSASYITIADVELRKQIERILIRFLKSNAVLNKQHVVK